MFAGWCTPGSCAKLRPAGRFANRREIYYLVQVNFCADFLDVALCSYELGQPEDG